MINKSRKTQKGFTLVELAIVLVIIGLIVSGVLVGQDLIKAAELRATVRQHQEFQVAVNTFIGKYNSIPGDIDGNKFGLTGGCDDGADGDGDGDGRIEDGAPTAGGPRNTHNGEIACFWANLTTDGKELIKGVFDGTAAASNTVGTHMPQMKFGGRGWSVFTDGTDNFFIAGVTTAVAANAFTSTNSFIPIDAYDIDSKIDDGVPDAGAVQARLGAADVDTAASQFAGPSATACIDTNETPHGYQFTATAPQCTMVIRMETF